MEGEAESKMLKGLKRKRKHIQVMERLNAMNDLSTNKGLVIFGDQGNNLMASLDSFNMVYKKNV